METRFFCDAIYVVYMDGKSNALQRKLVNQCYVSKDFFQSILPYDFILKLKYDMILKLYECACYSKSNAKENNELVSLSIQWNTGNMYICNDNIYIYT